MAPTNISIRSAPRNRSRKRAISSRSRTSAGNSYRKAPSSTCRRYHDHPGPGEVDEATDTYDSIDWLLKNIPHNNGRVGQYGISYLGYYSTLGILSRHPALKAVSPQAPVTDWFRGDDFHHNGALFLTDAFDFMSGFGVARSDADERAHPRPRALQAGRVSLLSR